MSTTTIALPKVAVRLRSNAPSAAQIQAAKVLASFNTWAFKREHPSNLAQTEARIAAAVAAGRPVPFVLYWGKGPRQAAAAPEHDCLKYLAGLGARIAQAYAPGAHFTLIFTDTHAALNGHSRESYEQYFGEVERAALGMACSTVRLSQLVAAAGPHVVDPDDLDADHLGVLLKSAARWFRGTGTPREGALRYLIANMAERRGVELAFPEAIFATFSGSDLDFLFPSALPRFYMYSLRKGCSVKPWFVDADGRPYEAAV